MCVHLCVSVCVCVCVSLCVLPQPLSCGHFFHRACLKAHILSKIGELQASIPCPTCSPRRELGDVEVREALNKKEVGRYEQASLMKAVRESVVNGVRGRGWLCMTLRHVVCAIAHGWGSDCTDTGRRCCWDGTNTSLLVFQAMGSSSAIRACPHVDCSKYFFVTVSHSAPASAALDLADTRWPARCSSCGKSLTLVCLLPRVLTASRGRRGGGRLPGRLGRGLRTQVAGGGTGHW